MVKSVYQYFQKKPKMILKCLVLSRKPQITQSTLIEDLFLITQTYLWIIKIVGDNFNIWQ